MNLRDMKQNLRVQNLYMLRLAVLDCWEQNLANSKLCLPINKLNYFWSVLLVLRSLTLRVKFRRQMPIEGYVADFGSLEAKVIVELDGSQHLDMQRADASRTHAIEAAGFVVLRFWNSDVNENIEGVLTEIAVAIRHRLPDR